MKILVTGGLGYLGRAVLDSLVYSGHTLRVLTHSLSEKERDDLPDVDFIIGDVLSDSDLDKACKDIDIVIHLAALDVPTCKEYPEKGILVNGIGTRKLLIAASNNFVKKIIYMSTFHVYDALEGDIKETSRLFPKTDYAISKLVGEYYCQNFSGNTKYTILRLSNVLGYSKSKRGNTLAVNDFVEQCLKNNEIILKTTGTQRRNFVSINDVVKAIEIIIQSPKETDNEIFNVGGYENLSIYEVAKKVSEIYREMYKENVIIRTGNIKDDNDNETTLTFVFDKISKIGYNPTNTISDEIKKIFINIEKNSNAQQKR